MNLRVVAPDAFGAAALVALLEAISGVPAPVLGLATGRTPVPLYAALREAVARGEARVDHVRAFAIDEYVGARAHPCANRAFFARHWLAIPGAPGVKQFDPEAPSLDAEVQRFSAVLERAGGLDVALLGVGMNGHLAFNEPGSARDSTARRVALSPDSRGAARGCWGERTPAEGLTLGLRDLLGARRVLLLANGEHKASIVARALSGVVSEHCPASFVQDHAATVVVLDAGAASGL